MKLGTRKDVTQAEQFILKEFSSNYISVKLSNKFILDISEPIMTCINHFEAEEPKLFERFDVLGDFLVTFMGKFLKNGGRKKTTKCDVVCTTKDLLDVDVSDRSLQLDDKNIYLGPKVENFLLELGLSRTRPELAPWLKNVR